MKLEKGMQVTCLTCNGFVITGEVKSILERTVVVSNANNRALVKIKELEKQGYIISKNNNNKTRKDFIID